MAQVARMAGVGRATVYRNFPTRQTLLEALFTDEVDELTASASCDSSASPADALLAWLRRFAEFHGRKSVIAAELLEHTTTTDPVFRTSRQRVVAAGEPLLTAAQHAGQVRGDVTLDDALDLVLALARLDRPRKAVHRLLDVALDGLLTPTAQIPRC